MSVDQLGIFHKLFILLFNLYLILGLYFDFKEKSNQDKRIKEKITNEIKSEICLEIDEDEKYMLNNLTTLNGYNTIEEFISNILKEELN